jgi:hypothetical protein
VTLGVAGVCPWGPFVGQFKAYGFEIHEAVILATDSRWSVGGQPLLDVGKKLYQVGPAVGAIYAGDVAAAYSGITALRRVYGRARPHSIEALERLSQWTFAQSFERERASRKAQGARCGPVFYVLGVGSRAEGVGLLKLESRAAFKPEAVKGVVMIGWPTARDTFARFLASGLDEWYRAGKVADHVTDWAIAVTGSLDQVIRAQRERTVGGKVQLAIVSPDKFAPLRIVSLDKVADPPEEDVWRTITVDSPLKELPESLDRRISHSVSGDFGLHHVVD